MKRLWDWIRCDLLGDHDWTCKAEQGIPPDREKMKADPMGYFWIYARGYCSRCGKKLKSLSVQIRDGNPRTIEIESKEPHDEAQGNAR